MQRRFDGVGQHEAQDQRGATVIEFLQHVSQRPEHEDVDHIHRVLLGRKGAEHHNRQQKRRQDMALEVSDLGDVARQQDHHRRRQQIGYRHHHGEADTQVHVLLEEFRSGLEAQNQETAQQQGHARGTGNTERQGRHQGAAFLGVVGRFRGDDAFDRPLTEQFRMLGGLLGRGIGDKGRSFAADPRNHAHDGADSRAFEEQRRMAEHLMDAFLDLGEGNARILGLMGDSPPLG